MCSTLEKTLRLYKYDLKQMKTNIKQFFLNNNMISVDIEKKM